MEATGNENELLTERLRQTEKDLTQARKESSNFQNMLLQSQSQFTTLDRKYNKAKRLVREYQQREVDMVHHEEVYLQLIQEKDTEYNALVKNLKDRIINLEKELQDTQIKAGLPISLPYDSANSLRLTPQMSRRQPPKPLFHKLDIGLSDTEISDLSPDGDDDKTATVERKIPAAVKDELDSVVPQHELLDSSANKCKSDLASRGGLAKRQLPSGKKSLSNSSSDCALNESEEELTTDSTSISNATAAAAAASSENGHSNGHNYKVLRNRSQQESSSAAAIDDQPPLYAQVHKDRSSGGSGNGSASAGGGVGGGGNVDIVTSNIHSHYMQHSTIPNIYKNASIDSSPAAYNNDLNSSYDSILGSNDKLQESGGGSGGQNVLDNWMYPSRRRGKAPSSFTDQLNQVLSDREK